MDKLSRLMNKHNLSDKDVAKLLEVSVYTVRAWQYPKEWKSARNIPPIKLKMLKMLVEE